MIEKNIKDMYYGTNNIYASNVSSMTVQNPTESAIRDECDALATLLIEKNRSYGNSALDPVRIFSGSDNIEQLKVRIDDKLSRFMRGKEYMGDNDIDDLMGYLVLLKIAMKGNWK